MHNPAILVALTATLAALPATNAFYTKNSPVLQLNAKSYEKLIAKSNYTSIVEFYAPWCGHCQNLKPAYEKVAKSLEGLAKVAAVDCDQDENKNFCGAMGVKGFPTLKIVRPNKSGGKPVVEDYQGQRTANAIAQALSNKINNHVTRVSDKDLDKFLEGEKPKAILFTEKGPVSALLRSIAIDFLDVISVGQVRNTEKDAVKKFGITSFPTLVLVANQDDDPIVYDGELKKKDMVKFLSQVGEPNPDPAPAKNGGKKKKDAKKQDKKDTKIDTKTDTKTNTKTDTKKSKKSKKSAEDKPSPKPEEAEKPSTSAPTSTSTSETTDMHAATDIPISSITTQEKLVEECLSDRSHTCVLVFAPSTESEAGEKAVGALTHLNTKYIQGKRHLFPFFSIPSDSEAAAILPQRLQLKGEVNMIAINYRRAWWRQFQGDFSVQGVEGWIDSIRMGEGAKNKLPKNILGSIDADDKATQATDPEPEVETGAGETEAETEVPEADVEDEVTEPSAEGETGAPEPEAEERIVHEEL